MICSRRTLILEIMITIAIMRASRRSFFIYNSSEFDNCSTRSVSAWDSSCDCRNLFLGKHADANAALSWYLSLRPAVDVFFLFSLFQYPFLSKGLYSCPVYRIRETGFLFDYALEKWNIFGYLPVFLSYVKYISSCSHAFLSVWVVGRSRHSKGRPVQCGAMAGRVGGDRATVFFRLQLRKISLEY